MLQHSRRRVLAGMALLGFGSSFLTRGALAQTATSMRCEAPVTSKSVTGLKPLSAQGGIFQNLSGGKMSTDPEMFGHRTEFKISGKPGKLGKGVTISSSNASATLTLAYSKGERQSGDSLSINITFPTILVGDLYPVNTPLSLLMTVPGFKDTSGTVSSDGSAQTRSVTPNASLYIFATAGQIKSRLPKSGDFSGKLMLKGKQIGEIKFPKLNLAKIIDELGKEHGKRAKEIATDQALSGDLTYATLPAGCGISKPSSTGSGGCYLTTAAVEIVGLPDDCWELRQLREFRDRFADQGGAAAALMAEYYTHAPLVVNAINERPNAERIWLHAYWRGIVPAAIASRWGFDRIALSIYSKWTRKLHQIAAN